MSNLWIHASQTDPMWGLGPESVVGHPGHEDRPEHAAPVPVEEHDEDSDSQTQPYVPQEKSDAAQHARNKGYQGNNPALVGAVMQGIEQKSDERQTKHFLRHLRSTDPDSHAFVVHHMREQGHAIPKH